MTSEERFERTERTLAVLAETQTVHSRNLAHLMEIAQGHIDVSNFRIEANTQAIAELSASVSALFSAADTRMRRIEDNLDALIRAITAEHSTGTPGHS